MLPFRPFRDLGVAIPNTQSPYSEKYFVRTPQGPFPVDGSLSVDPESGEISLAGSSPSPEPEPEEA